jgi:UrcA family protein
MNRNSIGSVAGLAYAAILTGSFATGACAFAASSENQLPHVTVKYGDLNLNVREGIDTLYQRIKGAARSVCDQAISGSEPFRHNQWNSCYNTAVANAVAKVNNTQLTLRHAQSTTRRVG